MHWWSVLHTAWLGHRGDRERIAGRYERAGELIRAALAVAEGPSRETTRRSPSSPAARRGDRITASLLNTLGLIHTHQRRFEDGLGAYRRGLEIARRHRPKEYPLIATFMHNIAGLEHARGRDVRAEPFARRAVALRERALGPHHPDVGRDIGALAAILDGRGRHTEAETLHRRALRIFQHRLPAKHPDIAATFLNLAACLHAQRRSA